MNSNTNTNTNQIIFIDSRVQDIPSLLAGFSADAEVHVIDASQDGLAQMNELLAGRSGLDAIHLMGHGSSGSTQMGTTTLSSTTLQQYSSALSALGQSLTSDGDLLLYGCDVAKGETGEAFVNQLAALTGADVAASTDLTGKNGDWVLEYQAGQINDGSLWASTTPLDYGFDLFRAGWASQFTTENTQITQAGTIYKASSNTIGMYAGIFTLSTSDGGINIDLKFTINWDSIRINTIETRGLVSYGVTPNGSNWDVTARWNYTDALIPQAGSASYQLDYDRGNFSKYFAVEVFAPFVTQSLVSNGQLLFNGNQQWNTNGSGATLNWVVNATPSFIGGTTETLSYTTTTNTAQDLTSKLLVSDTDASQTETWTQVTGPSHGTLSITGATASSGSASITPGGTMTYTPTGGYNGTDTFSIR